MLMPAARMFACPPGRRAAAANCGLASSRYDRVDDDAYGLRHIGEASEPCGVVVDHPEYVDHAIPCMDDEADDAPIRLYRSKIQEQIRFAALTAIQRPLG